MNTSLNWMDSLKRKCANCGKPYGSHHAGSTDRWPRDYCPDKEESMDWEKGPGTTFSEAEDQIETRTE